MKKPFSNEPMDRREFLRGSLRYGLLAGLAALTARTLTRRGAQSCTNEGICRGCPVYTGCELPQALSAKQAGVPAGISNSAYQEIRRIPGTATPSRSLEIGPDDRLYLATGNSIVILTQEGVREREIALDAPVRSLAIDGEGKIFAGLRDRVEIFNTQGVCTGGWEIPGKRTWITGLALGIDALFIADAGNRVIHRYDFSGRFVARIGEKTSREDGPPGFVIPSPYFSVKLHPDGLLRVNNPGRHRVETYTVDGDFEGAWGKPSGAPDGFCGCCNPIRLALLPDGRVLTCEKGLPRVKLFSATGEFDLLVADERSFPENAKVGAGERDADAALAGIAAAVDSKGRIAILDHVTGEIRILQPKTSA